MLRHCWMVLALAIGLVGPAQAQVKLEWKFTQGDKFYMENVTSLKQVMEIMGQKVPMDTVNTTVSSFKVLKAAPDEVVLEQKIESVKIKAAQGAAPQAQVAEKMTGSVFKVTLNGKGEVTKLEGFDELIKKLSENNDEIGKLLKAILTEDTMKQGVQEAFSFVPGKPVNKGDSWKRQMRVAMGPMGTFIVDLEYTYQGKGKDGEEVAVKGSYSYEAPKAGAGGLPFKVTKGEFKTDDAKGLLIFDTTQGRLVRHEFKSKLNGTMSIGIGDQNATMDLKQETDTRIRVLKDMPKSE
ncbi:hypothetical protein AYO44_16320 [Planctomycetaceae bacterium SCGC AG-212-F19]|nr:hypothetical protein AYO44_16320 [Planctomycetaceae bacterium SCGC AG-212-F19]